MRCVDVVICACDVSVYRVVVGPKMNCTVTNKRRFNGNAPSASALISNGEGNSLIMSICGLNAVELNHEQFHEMRLGSDKRPVK